MSTINPPASAIENVGIGQPLLRLAGRGRAWKFGDFLDAEELCLTQYFALPPDQLREHVLETVRPEFGAQVRTGDVVVGGRGFGVGAGHDHCNVALKATGIAGVVAVSFGTQFYRHSVDHAVPLVRSTEAAQEISEGDDVEVNFDTGDIVNHTTGASHVGSPMGKAQLEVVHAGGLVDYIRQRMALDREE